MGKDVAELLDKFWDGREVYDETLTKCIGAIRKALDDQQERFIETRYGEGYRFIGPLEERVAGDGFSILEIERMRGVEIIVEEEVSNGILSEDAAMTSLPAGGAMGGGRPGQTITLLDRFFLRRAG